MSIQFNDTTNKKGIIQGIERALLFDDGFISDDSDRLKDWTAEVNMAVDEVESFLQMAGGTHQHDDINHTKYNEFTFNLVADQRDYSFTIDEQGNKITDIMRVFVIPENGTTYQEVMPVDAEIGTDNLAFYDGNTTTGVPYKYNKVGSGIFFDPEPGYNKTNGGKIIYKREPDYFTYEDTTKTPGFNPLFHEYLILRPAYRYARDNGIESERLKRDLLEMKKSILDYHGLKDQNQRKVIRTRTSNPNSFI